MNGSQLISMPRMIAVSQTYPASRTLNIAALLGEQFSRTGLREKIKPGMTVALGVGSRGITNLKEIVLATLQVLTEAGARPFIVPAMGSHGGATAEGQIEVLAQYGVTEQAMGVPIRAEMTVRKIGTAFDGFDVVLGTAALEADGIVVLNRVKPHTDFRGTLGSGMQKMLVIGFGKQIGANNAHRAAAHLGYERVLREFAKTILETAPILCGIALVEDQHHQTAEMEVVAAGNIVRDEDRLFKKAESLLARLPFEDIDLLIVDRLGKDISGSGMDTNVIGRDVSGYIASLHSQSPVTPRISRIFVRDLTPASSGNGTGIGMADFTTARFVKALNLQYTYMNALTSLGLLPAKIPIYFDNDRQAIEAGLASLAEPDPAKWRVVRISDTLNLEHFLASERCMITLNGNPGITVLGPPQDMEFDAAQNLLPI
jgi:Lactate racemase N-terminal domain